MTSFTPINRPHALPDGGLFQGQLRVHAASHQDVVDIFAILGLHADQPAVTLAHAMDQIHVIYKHMAGDPASSQRSIITTGFRVPVLHQVQWLERILETMTAGDFEAMRLAWSQRSKLTWNPKAEAGTAEAMQPPPPTLDNGISAYPQLRAQYAPETMTGRPSWAKHFEIPRPQTKIIYCMENDMENRYRQRGWHPRIWIADSEGTVFCADL